MGNNIWKVALFTGAMLAMGGCATSAGPTPQQTGEAFFTQSHISETAGKLSGAKNVATSADGSMVCKRQAMIGSKFKRKICAPVDDWDDVATESRAAVRNMTRAGGPR